MTRTGGASGRHMMAVDLVADIETEPESALLAQTAQAAEYMDGRIVLRGISASSLYLGNRSQRVVGHIATNDLVKFWERGDNGFTNDPPMAVLAFVRENESTPDDVVFRITNPVLVGETLSYAASIVEGYLQRQNGPCTLFIDATGRTLSPVSFTASVRLTRVRGRSRMNVLDVPRYVRFDE